MNKIFNKKIIFILSTIIILLSISSVVQSAPTLVICYGEPQYAQIGNTITWTAIAQGGTGSVTWSGDGNPRGVGVNARSSYSTLGIKNVTATIKDSVTGNTTSGACSVTINETGERPTGINDGSDVDDERGGVSGSWDEEGFVPLQEIKGVIDAETAKDPSLFFNRMFTFGIIIAGFLAVVMIAIGGIQYMSTDAVSGKGEGRERITYALMGLLLILFSWILLNTINPDILNFDLFN